MKIDEMIHLMSKDNPRLLSSVPPKKSKAIVRAVLICLRKAVEGTEEGKVKISGLGGFHVRRIDREAGGKKITSKVVVFRAAKPKTKTGA
jgi:nucleoid DNA-binding protein